MAQALYCTPDQAYFAKEAYSAFHRTASLKRFLAYDEARAMSCIDLDGTIYVEYSNLGRVPLLVLETALDTGQRIKPSTVLQHTSHLHFLLPAYTVLFRTSQSRNNPADNRFPDVESIRMRRLYPEPDAWENWRIYTPAEFAQGLSKMRDYMEKRVLSLIEFRNRVEPEVAKILGAGQMPFDVSGLAFQPVENAGKPDSVSFTAESIQW